jgi:hypothetical protein
VLPLLPLVLLLPLLLLLALLVLAPLYDRWRVRLLWRRIRCSVCSVLSVELSTDQRVPNGKNIPQKRRTRMRSLPPCKSTV